MRHILYYIILLSCIFSLNQNIHGQINVFTETFTTKNGLAQNDVNDIQKDKNGFIWLATENGFSRFDGYVFVNHKISTTQFHCSLNNQFQKIVVDDNNNIWTRNSMGQVVLYNQKKQEYTLYPDPQNNRGENYMQIKSICYVKGRGVWLLGSEKGLINITEKDGKFISSYYCTANNKLGTKVNCIRDDQEGNIWILTNCGVGFISKNSKQISANYFYKEHYCFNDGVDLGSDFVLVGNEGQCFKYDQIKRRFTSIKLPTNDNINNVYRGASNNVVLTSQNEIIEINTNSSAINKTVKISNINNGWQDEKGNVWLNNNQVLYKYDVKKSLLETTNINLPTKYNQEITDKENFSFAYLLNDDVLDFISTNESNKHPNTNNICKVLKDGDDVYWLNTNSNGIKKCITANSLFKYIKTAKNLSNGVCAVMVDNLGRSWVASTDQRIGIYDSNMQLIGFLDKSGTISKNECTFVRATAIYQDRENNIWIGTRTNLIKLTASSSQSYKVKNYSLDKETPVGTFITDIIQDKNGHIWITTDGDGLQLLTENNGDYHFCNRRTELKNSYPPTLLKTNCLYEDNKGNIWIGSSEGLAIFSSDYPQLRFLKFFYYNPENSNMTASVVSSLFEDRDGKMWIASYGGGLFRTTNSFELGETPEFIAYNKGNNKLGTDLILSVEEDENGNIWVATENSIVKLNKSTGKNETFRFSNEIGYNEFGRQIFAKTKNKNFILGSRSGFYVINPYDIKTDNFIPKVVFTRFQLFNKDIDINSEDSPLKSDINFADEITLSHKQNVFSIEFSALDFRNSSDIEYAYKLDNFEDDWNYVGSQRIATYTNLPPGDYVFRVKSTNSAGNWCTNDKTITIHVLPSFWQTGWAWLLYILLLAGFVGGVVYAYLAFYKMRSKMQVEQELSTMKMQFFTDISHELRTPLTLINAPLENVLENGSISQEDRKQLEIVHSNSNRMLRMLTQILDFRKLQSNKMRLRVEKTDINELIVKCCSNFSKMAEKRNIQFSISNNLNNPFFWIDRDKIDTVMFNLLSNAFKFTAEGKSISVDLSNSIDNDCIIAVKDEGCGMPKDKLGSIFDRFSTLRPKSLTNQSGTGIGLALVKEIVDLHRGTISVESEEDKGSVFTVTLKKGTEHYDTLFADIVVDDQDLPAQKTTEFTQIEDNNRLKLLIIEDNDDLRQFIVSVLSKTYQIVEAANGKEGIDKTIKELPDFVISDIMMPIMDGIEYVKQIRANTDTSHIPIILLTAKTDMQSKLECLKLGANDYITKPFSMVYLQARVENILEERKHWQEKYRLQIQGSINGPSLNTITTTQQVEETMVDKKDDEFMKKVVEYVNQHMEDSNLSPEELANGVKVSRWTLTCKIKSLVGQPPVEFIKDIRLNRAAQLIKEGELSMTQISYMIGMTDSRYFSRCFKQKFGMTPTEYKNIK